MDCTVSCFVNFELVLTSYAVSVNYPISYQLSYNMLLQVLQLAVKLAQTAISVQECVVPQSLFQSVLIIHGKTVCLFLIRTFANYQLVSYPIMPGLNDFLCGLFILSFDLSVGFVVSTNDQDLKVPLANLCKTWWQNNIDGRESLTSAPLIYYIEKCLMKKPTLKVCVEGR